jgi:hypothetical protein
MQASLAYVPGETERLLSASGGNRPKTSSVKKRRREEHVEISIEDAAVGRDGALSHRVRGPATPEGGLSTKGLSRGSVSEKGG